MTTFRRSNTPVPVNTHAAFRNAISKYTSLLSAVGLLQTDDTGQLNALTANLPAQGAYAGFQVWRFNDTLKDARPVLIKIEFGMYANYLQVRYRIGTKTDGAGAFVGIVSSWSDNANVAEDRGDAFSCHTDGFFGLVADNYGYSTIAAFAVCRSCDADGIPSAAAIYVHFGGTVKAQVLSFYGHDEVIPPLPSATIAYFPLDVIRSIDGNAPVYPLWMPIPQLVPVFGLAFSAGQLLPAVDTFDLALIGSAVRRYIAIPKGLQASETGPLFLMLWE